RYPAPDRLGHGDPSKQTPCRRAAFALARIPGPLCKCNAQPSCVVQVHNAQRRGAQRAKARSVTPAPAPLAPTIATVSDALGPKTLIPANPATVSAGFARSTPRRKSEGVAPGLGEDTHSTSAPRITGRT